MKEELRKTRPLEEVCAALREELDAAHRQRIEAFEIKMKPIIIRDGPSKKVSKKYCWDSSHLFIPCYRCSSIRPLDFFCSEVKDERV